MKKNLFQIVYEIHCVTVDDVTLATLQICLIAFLDSY